jgi:DNA-binding response OmpR family regulator
MSAVLVIEEDDRIRLSRVLALDDEGYAATGVATAEEGLAVQDGTPADTVLVDLMLPGIDGFECIRQLRRIDDVPIVVISARDDTHDIVAALEAGANDYLVKPVAVKELTARLRALRRAPALQRRTRCRCCGLKRWRSCPARVRCGAPARHAGVVDAD